jgi:hypothetical protein
MKLSVDKGGFTNSKSPSHVRKSESFTSTAVCRTDARTDQAFRSSVLKKVACRGRGACAVLW